MSKVQYFKIDPKRKDYHGTRYFKFQWGEDHCVQVCKFPGDVKKGKSNTIGIYIISSMTLLTNYVAIGFAIPCSKSEYEKAFDFVVKILKNPAK